MRGLLEFENKMNFVQFERLKDYFFNYQEITIKKITEKDDPVKDKGPLTKTIQILKDQENFFFDQDKKITHGRQETLNFNTQELPQLFVNFLY